MRITFVNTPLMDYSTRKRKISQKMAPLGLAMLATIAKNKGHDVQFIDAESEEMSIAEILSHVKDYRPDYLCINIFSPTNAISSKIINNANCKIIVGGYHATLCSTEILKKHKNIYVVIRGEAEIAFGEILDSKPLRDISSITFKENNQIIINPEPTNLIDIDKLPAIERSFIKFEIQKSKEASIIASRGCCYSCVFCTIPRFSRGVIRWRSPKSVEGEIKSIVQKYNIKRFHFLDNIFLHDINWTKKFISYLEADKLRIKWRCITRADIIARLSDSVLAKIKKAGCIKISIGFESGSQRMLDLMNKSLSIIQSKKAITKCLKAGINIKGYFLIGHPKETKEDLDKTLQFIYETNLNDVRLIPLKVYPGTTLFETFGKAKTLQNYIQLKNLFKSNKKRKKEFNEKNLMKYLQVQPSFHNSCDILKWIRHAYQQIYSF